MARPSDVLKLRHEVHHGRVVRAYVGRPDNVSAMFAQAVGRAADTTACVDGDDRPTYPLWEGIRDLSLRHGWPNAGYRQEIASRC